MPCDPAPNDVAARPRRRSLLGDILVVFGLMPPYVVFYPLVWARNQALLRRWRRETSSVARGRWQLEGDTLRLCLGGHERVVELSSIRSVHWTEHCVSRGLAGADSSDFLVRLQLGDGSPASLVLSDAADDDAVFRRLKAIGKLTGSPCRGGHEQRAGTTVLFAAGSALSWALIVLVWLWLRAHG